MIKRVDTSGQPESIGASAKFPQVRLRPVSKFPKTARKVLDDHHLTFAGYKRVKRQVRALAAMGEIFILSSRKHRVLLDRHPDFDTSLIERELARWKSDAVNSFLSDLTDFIENMPKETLPKEVAPKRPGRKSKSSLVDFPIKKDQIDENLGPYGQQEQLLKRWVGLMEPELIEGIKQFIEKRRKQIEDAKLRKPKRDDLDRTEVD